MVSLRARRRRGLRFAKGAASRDGKRQAAPGDAGVVSVVHNDGPTRVTLCSKENCGETLVANPDIKATVKLKAETALGGGQIVVNGPNGKPAVIVCHHHAVGGVVLTKNLDGKPAATLPDAGYGEEESERG